MPCETMTLPDGTRVIACTRGASGRPKPCRWCASSSVAHCDFPVRRKGKATTCDAPMCEAHRHRKGPDIDHCPDHVGARPEA